MKDQSWQRLAIASIKRQKIAADVDVELISSNGWIEYRDIAGSARARTSDINIAPTLDQDSQSPLNAKSSNDSITLSVSRHSAGKFDLSTSNRSVKIDEALESSVVSRPKKKRSRLHFGNGGPSPSGTTSNGLIRVEMSR